MLDDSGEFEAEIQPEDDDGLAAMQVRDRPQLGVRLLRQLRYDGQPHRERLGQPSTRGRLERTGVHLRDPLTDHRVLNVTGQQQDPGGTHEIHRATYSRSFGISVTTFPLR